MSKTIITGPQAQITSPLLAFDFSDYAERSHKSISEISHTSIGFQCQSSEVGRNILIAKQELDEYALLTNQRQETITNKNSYPAIGNIRFVHKNKMPIESFDLLPDRFGDNSVSLVKTLFKAAEDRLKNNLVLVSTAGSITYALLEDERTPDWDNIQDIDLRVHTNKDLSDKQKLKLIKHLFDVLQKNGITTETDKQLSFHNWGVQGWSIKDKTEKMYGMHITIEHLDKLFGNKSTMGRYKAFDNFYGTNDSLTKLRDKLKEVGIEGILGEEEKFYYEFLGKIQDSTKNNVPEVKKLKYIKRMYQMFALRGRGKEYKWLLDEYKGLKKKFDEDKYQAIVSYSLPELESIERLQEELIEYFERREKNFSGLVLTQTKKDESYTNKLAELFYDILNKVTKFLK